LTACKAVVAALRESRLILPDMKRFVPNKQIADCEYIAPAPPITHVPIQRWLVLVISVNDSNTIFSLEAKLVVYSVLLPSF
jgi:hypothetical protein